MLGVGSYTYQYVTRDTFGFAMKATWAEIDGEGRNLFKDPVTDSGTKRSATGRLAVRRDNNGELALLQCATADQERDSEMAVVWENGKFVRRWSFGEVRANLRNGWS